MSELTARGSKTRELGEFCSALVTSEVPEEVIHNSKRALLDWLAAVLTGVADPAARKLREVVAETAPDGTARIAGTGQRTVPPFAALVNGYTSHLNDFDDVFNPVETTVHLGSCLWPALFALGELRPITGPKAIAGFIAGFETGARVACAAGPEHYESAWQVTGTVGRVAAAAAAATALSLPAEAATNALGIGATQAAGLREVYGTDSKALQPAKAAMDGLMAGLLAEQGFTSRDTSLEGHRGLLRAVSPNPDPALLIEGLGTNWRLLENGHKLYPSASLTHPVIDAAIAIAARAALSPPEVREVTAYMHPFAAEVTARRHPAPGTDARFSARHCVAVALLRGQVGLADFTAASIADDAVSGLRDQIDLVADESCPKRAARLRVTMSDGAVLEAEVDQNRGSPANPLSDTDLEEKFAAAARPFADPLAAKDIIAQCWVLESAGDIRDVITQLTPLGGG